MQVISRIKTNRKLTTLDRNDKNLSQAKIVVAKAQNKMTQIQTDKAVKWTFSICTVLCLGRMMTEQQVRLPKGLFFHQMTIIWSIKLKDKRFYLLFPAWKQLRDYYYTAP